MVLDFIFHGGADLNAKMHHTAGFDDVCRQTFERWHLRIEGNVYFKEGRFLEMPVAAADARLAIRTFWVKEPGARAECFYLGVKLTRESYRESGDYYRLILALCALSLDRIKEFVSFGQKLDLALTMPMRRQSIWVDFGTLSGARKIGAENFAENLEDVLLSISVNNIDDWFERMYLAIDPAIDLPELNVVVSRQSPKSYSKANPNFSLSDRDSEPVHEPIQPRKIRLSVSPIVVFGTLFIDLFLGFVIGLLCGIAKERNDSCEMVKRAYESGYKTGYDEGVSASRKEPSRLERIANSAQEKLSGLIGPKSDVQEKKDESSVTNRVEAGKAEPS